MGNQPSPRDWCGLCALFLSGVATSRSGMRQTNCLTHATISGTLKPCLGALEPGPTNSNNSLAHWAALGRMKCAARG